ncbi:hypothetical protein ANTQUA_LOCUS5872 [Anthophora quadrimaculata]
MIVRAYGKRWSRATSQSKADLEKFQQQLREKEKRLQESAARLESERSVTAEARAAQPTDTLTAQLLNELASIRRELNEVKNTKPQIVPDHDYEMMEAPTRLLASNLDADTGAMSTYSLREAVETVPTFDGNNISVFQFIRDCKRARDLIAPNAEGTLVRLIINRLKGRAYLAIEDEPCGNVQDLCDVMRLTFGPQKNVDQYRGALASTFQLSDEHIIDFISRVEDLRAAIFDCERSSKHADQVAIDEFTLRCLIDGLILEIRHQLIASRPATLSAAFTRSREIYRRHELDLEQQRHAQKATYAAKTAQRTTDIKIPRQRTTQAPCAPTHKTCTYCKNIGHTIDECRKRLFNNYQRERYPEPRRIDERERRSKSGKRTRPLASPREQARGKPREGSRNSSRDRGGGCRVATVKLKTNCFVQHVDIFSDDFSKNAARLMVDTGSEPNLIKKSALKRHLTIKPDNALAISGITDGRVKTHGSVIVQIRDRGILFHVVSDDFPIETDGILGSEFCNHEVDILYSKNRLVWNNIQIPFANVPDIIIPPRSSKCIAINVREKHPGVGIIPRIDVAPGVYLGEALVSNRQGKAYTRAFNTTERRIKIPTPTAALEEVSLAGYDKPKVNRDAFRSSEVMRNGADSQSRAYHITDRDISGPGVQRSPSRSSAISPASDNTRAAGSLNTLGNRRDSVPSHSTVSFSKPRGKIETPPSNSGFTRTESSVSSLKPRGKIETPPSNSGFNRTESSISSLKPRGKIETPPSNSGFNRTESSVSSLKPRGKIETPPSNSGFNRTESTGNEQEDR